MRISHTRHFVGWSVLALLTGTAFVIGFFFIQQARSQAQSQQQMMPQGRMMMGPSQGRWMWPGYGMMRGCKVRWGRAWAHGWVGAPAWCGTCTTCTMAYPPSIAARSTHCPPATRMFGVLRPTQTIAPHVTAHAASEMVRQASTSILGFYRRDAGITG